MDLRCSAETQKSVGGNSMGVQLPSRHHTVFSIGVYYSRGYRDRDNPTERLPSGKVRFYRYRNRYRVHLFYFQLLEWISPTVQRRTLCLGWTIGPPTAAIIRRHSRDGPNRYGSTRAANSTDSNLWTASTCTRPLCSKENAVIAEHEGGRRIESARH